MSSLTNPKVALIQTPDVAPVINPRVLSLDESLWRSATLTLAAQLAATAVQRDQQGGSAQAEKQLFRDSGLLRLSIPQRLGGAGSSWPEIYRIVRYLAAVDSSLAHLFAFHHLQLATIQLFANAEQQDYWLRLGGLWARLDAATLLAERAAGRLQQLLDQPSPSPEERGELAIWIAEAKLLSARVALDITSEVFETMGARATSSRFGFDRFWRNVRVHTLHDPLDHKQKDIGRWLLTGEHPTPSNYS